MTISVHFIEGNRQAVCKNNAWSVVRNDRELLAIIPVDTLRRAGQDQDALKTAFRQVHENNPGLPGQELTATAARLLKLRL